MVGSNCVRSLALQLATGALGGMFASFATDIGEKALIDRLQIVEPRFLFTESVYSYNGKKVDIRGKISRVYDQLQRGSCQLVVIGPALESQSG